MFNHRHAINDGLVYPIGGHTKVEKCALTHDLNSIHIVDP